MIDGTTSYSRDRLKFALYVYLISLTWLVIALVQWLIINLLPNAGGVFAVGILLGVALVLVNQLNKIWLNWILTALTIEFGILGMAALVITSLWPELLLWIFISSLLIVDCIVLNIYLPCDLTKDAFTLHIISCVFFFGSIFIHMMYVIITSSYFSVMFQILLSAIVVMAISGALYAELVPEDFLLPSVAFFYHFVVLFLLSFSAHQYKFGTWTMVAIGWLNPSLLKENEAS
ncbi:uncharacterized protein LOC115763444 isoform X2 [Drosophila novamexicana]|uniref:uncharacterized protein LOC115763444 isoform X2 n=1 Tax=Drosophila novamexicana TaxID=47314 RepID=UPI0011E5E5B6|nr:uncharacterized protein LOC115763444 isoform X2 [Drosophila novamexicana]